MSLSPSTLLDRLSPMPMVCPLVKLGRSSPPTADQGYHTALETQACHHANNEPNDGYNLQLRTSQNSDHNYHNDNSYSKHSAKKHLPVYSGDAYTDLKNELVAEKRCPTKSPPDSNRNLNFFVPEYKPRAQHRTADRTCSHTNQSQSIEQLQYCTRNEQTSNRSNSSLDCEQMCQQKFSYYGNNSNPIYYQNQTMLELSSLSMNGMYWNQASNQTSDLCQTDAMYRQHNDITQEYYNHNTQQPEKRVPSPMYTCNYLVNNFNKLGKSSPNLDQGYHTLVSPSPGPSLSNPWMDGNMNVNMFKGKRVHSKNNSFDKLPDDVILKIFSWLHSHDLSLCARVCRRFETLAWRPSLWRTITLYGEHICGDKAIRGVLRQLCGQGRTGSCPNIEKVYLSDGVKLTDRGLILLARRCPELTHLQLHGCTDISNPALFELVTRCANLQHLDITGCTNVSCISVVPGVEPPRRLFLQYLDLTDCSGIEDNGLRVIVRNCPQLVYLYLRRCIQITDAGLKHVPSFCLGLRELSVSDCSKVTDFGLYELAKLGATLRYLSVAKCDQVSDAGLKVIARRCYKLRYLNARGCEAVSDDAITILARSCTRLRALDIGKCDVSDAGLRALAECCPNIKKLSLRNCDLVTDRGVQCIAYYCRGLQQLNIQDCQISLEGYRAVKKYCKRCIIEHTNPGFF